MNTKVFLGFLAGAVAASGVYYFQSHRQNATVPAVAAVLTSETPVPVPVPTPDPVPIEAISAKPVASKKVVNAPSDPVKLPETPLSSAPPAASPEPAPEVAVALAPPPDPAAPVVPPAPPEPAVSKPEPPPPPQPRSVTLASGTALNVRLGETLASDKNRVGDTFSGTLDQPLVVDGLVIAERGARVAGRIRDLDEAGRVKGLARLVLELTSLNTSDGQKITIRTVGFESKGPESKKEDTEKVGAGAAIGAIIGAIAGGGKGAAIGAGAGGAAGGGVVAATRGKPAVLASETRLTFRIDQPVTITEKL